LPEIFSHVDKTKQYLATLGERLDKCLNSLPLGQSVMVENPALLET
jgi:hypothetical protein